MSQGLDKAREVLETQCSILEKMPPDSGRNPQLLDSSTIIGSHLHYGLSVDEATSRLIQACLSNGLDKDDGGIAGCYKTISNGLSCGVKSPTYRKGISSAENKTQYIPTKLTEIITSKDYFAEALPMWNEAKSEGTHDYLDSKKIIELYDARIGFYYNYKALFIPIFSFHNNELCSLQIIYYDSNGKRQKRNPGKYKEKDGIILFGKLDKRIAIAEGWATAEAIYRVTGTPSAVAITCSRLKCTAELYKEKYPNIEIIIRTSTTRKI